MLSFSLFSWWRSFLINNSPTKLQTAPLISFLLSLFCLVLLFLMLSFVSYRKFFELLCFLKVLSDGSVHSTRRSERTDSDPSWCVSSCYRSVWFHDWKTRFDASQQPSYFKPAYTCCSFPPSLIPEKNVRQPVVPRQQEADNCCTHGLTAGDYCLFLRTLCVHSSAAL